MILNVRTDSFLTLGWRINRMTQLGWRAPFISVYCSGLSFIYSMKDFILVRCFCCFNGEVDVVDHDLWSTMDVCPKMFLSWTSNPFFFLDKRCCLYQKQFLNSGSEIIIKLCVVWISFHPWNLPSNSWNYWGPHLFSCPCGWRWRWCTKSIAGWNVINNGTLQVWEPNRMGIVCI